MGRKRVKREREEIGKEEEKGNLREGEESKRREEGGEKNGEVQGLKEREDIEDE